MAGNNVEQAGRFNTGKLKWSLLPMNLLSDCVKVLMFGAEKYSPNNWRKGMPITEVYESLQRHINAFMAGEDDDEESGLSHLGHAFCNLVFMTHIFRHRKHFDDRYKEGDENNE